MKQPEKMTRKEFAQLNDWSPSYVTKLAQADRLVFTEHSNPRKQKVLVKESLARIEATKDPNRDDVSSRHKKARAAKGKNGSETEAAHSKPPSKSSQRVSTTFTESRAEKEYYLAQKAKAEHLKMIGELCETASARHAAGEAGTILRSALENQPDQLAPLLAAETDENRVHALMVEYNEQLLHDIADQFAAVMKKMVEIDH